MRKRPEIFLDLFPSLAWQDRRGLRPPPSPRGKPAAAPQTPRPSPKTPVSTWLSGEAKGALGTAESSRVKAGRQRQTKPVPPATEGRPCPSPRSPSFLRVPKQLIH